MRTSQRLRLCSGLTQLGVNVLLAGCAVAPPAPSGPMTVYDDGYWNARSCEGVEQPVMQNCIAAHARADLTPTETVAKVIPSRDEAMQALDRMLAETLKDPMSAQQYRVSDLEQCGRIVLSTIVDTKERGCLCYSVNAKNSYGGYAGPEFAVARILQTGRGNSFIAVPVGKSLFLSAASSCGTSPRDADAIRAAIR